MEELFKIWISNMIDNEIEETKGTIENEELWALGEPKNDFHEQNMILHRAYIDVLENLKDEINKR